MPSAVNASSFLDNLYQSEFGRAPDPGGKAYWTKALNSGVSPAKIKESFAASKEAKDRKAAGIKKGVKDTRTFKAAKAAVEKKKSATSLAAIKSHKAASTSKAKSTPSVTITPSSNNNVSSPSPSPSPPPSPGSSPSPSPAPQNLSPQPPPPPVTASSSTEDSDVTAVKGLYDSLLERPADQGGLDFWVKQIKDNGWDISKVEQSIRNSPEYETVQKENLDELYQDVLKRNPDAEGKEYWFDHMKNDGWNIDKVAESVDLSDEKWLRDTYEDILGRPLEGLDPAGGIGGIGADWDDADHSIRTGGDAFEGFGGKDWWLRDLGTTQTRADVLKNIKLSKEYDCYQKTGVAMNYDHSSGQCGATAQVCTPPQVSDGAGGCKDPDPTVECQAGESLVNGVCVPNNPTCGANQRLVNGQCQDIDPGGTTCTPPQVPDGSGGCKNPSGGDPGGNPGVGDITEDTSGHGDWMGPGDDSDPLDDPSGAYSKENRTQSYDNKMKEQQWLMNQTMMDKADLAGVDHKEMMNRVNEYIRGNQDRETSRLKSGIAIGGNQASIKPTSIKSGGPSWSDRTDDPGAVTVGPKAKDDRPYARAGMKRGSDKQSSFFYDKNYF